MILIQKSTKLFFRFHNDRLLSNSIYLMLSTFIMAGFGFFFWAICARFFSAEQIGIATTLISAAGLLSALSMFGLNASIMRFLPTSSNKNLLINTVMMTAFLLSIIFGIIFILGLEIFSPKLIFMKESVISSALFILYIAVMTLNNLTDNIFMSQRKAFIIPIINTLMNVIRLSLPLLLITLGGLGIFYSFVGAVGFALVLSICFLYYFFQFTPKRHLNIKALKEMWRFSFGNYLMSLFGSLSSMITPILITSRLNPEITAYYYMPSMVTGMIQAIPRSTSSSLFAEGSHHPEQLKTIAIKSLKNTYLLLLPVCIALFFLGGYILSVFGKNYSNEGILFLRMTIVGVLISGPSYLMGSIFNVKRKVKLNMYMNVINGVISLSLMYMLIGYGLFGLGLASILSQILILVTYTVALLITK